MSNKTEEIQAVMRFSKSMLYKLRQNHHKKHWSNTDLDYLIDRLEDEVFEMKAAYEKSKLPIKQSDAFEIQMECADIANFAMMIHDNLTSKEKWQ